MQYSFLTFLALCLLPVCGFAQAAGQAEADILQGLISGNVGLLMGLIIGAIGAWTFFIKGQAWGIIMLLGGVILTAFPSLFNSSYKAADPFLQGVAPGLERAEGLNR